MLRIWKYLLFSIVFITFPHGDILTWGGYTKIELTKPQLEEIIKEYVDTSYPKEVKEYDQKLQRIKEAKIDSVADVSFVDNNLMWQDTLKNKTSLLNQLESKRYCKELILAKRKDWRVPTYSELLTLTDYSKSSPAIISKVTHIVPNHYWSDTPKKMEKQQKEKTYWYVDFSSGGSDVANEMERKYIRCVRELSTKKDDY